MNKFKLITLAASFMLALAFFSCSGSNGIDGMNGTNGKDGLDGSSCEVKPSTNSEYAFDVYCGGTVVGHLSNGEDGKTGATGAKGDKGDKGDKGNDGEQGVPGVPGESGESCRIEVLTEHEHDYKIICGSNSVYLDNGDNGKNCSVADKDTYVEITCGDGESVQIPKGGEPGTQDSSSSSNESSSSSEPETQDSSSSSDKSSSSSEPISSSSSSVVCDIGTVKIGEQCWMKKNLDVVPTGANGAATNFGCNGEGAATSGYYNGRYEIITLTSQEIAANCETYGRLYNWATAMALPASCNEEKCEELIDTPHQGICPDGFHIPSNADWNELYRFVDGTLTNSTDLNVRFYISPKAGTKLKSSTLWESYNGIPAGKGDDGFAALPGGIYDYQHALFGGIREMGYWWSTSTVSIFSYVVAYQLIYESEGAGSGNINKNSGLSVRCLQD